MPSGWWCLILLGLVWLPSLSTAFSSPKGGNNDASPSRASSESDNDPVDATRRDVLWKVPVAGAGAWTLAYSNVLVDLAHPTLVYPEGHERRVSATIATALERAASVRATQRSANDADVPLRVLEVGIGKDCRLLRRGLYDDGLRSIHSSDNGRKVRQVEITGVDLLPTDEKALEDARLHLASLQSDGQLPLEVSVQAAQRSVTEPLDFPDGHFDCVVCCLTLCSVDEPDRAVREMNRLLRPDGGTLGYLEHVAVDPDEPYRFLELQQTTFDPLQQALVDNCHLHRYTERTIESVFGPPHAVRVSHERFLVRDMWPVTCQCCGVYQRTA
jgi:SAM-dependent methyltransferase